jgi:predicted anti-sigma-YlaC factor YlaD
MKYQHIRRLLENKPPGHLDDRELAAIETHIRDCEECRRAYQAARLSAQLLSERAAEVIEPSPFFATRVMAALREQQSVYSSSFRRFWQAAQSLVLGMVALVVLVGALGWFDSQPQMYSTDEVSAMNSDANDPLLPEPISEEMNYGQVISTIYNLDE